MTGRPNNHPERPITDIENERPNSSPSMPGSTAAIRADGRKGPLADIEFPGRRDRTECEAVIYTARDYLRDHSPVPTDEIIANVMPEHPLGYDVETALTRVEAGGRYRGSWWRRIVKPGLKALPDVEAPTSGVSKWRHVGNTDK